MEILNNQFVQGGAVLGIATGLIYSLKSVGLKIYNRIKSNIINVVNIYDYDELFFVLEKYISDNHFEKCRSLEASYISGQKIDDSRGSFLYGKVREVKFTQSSNFFTFKYKGKRLLIEKLKKEVEHAQSLRDLMSWNYQISGIKAKIKIEEFLKEITEEYNRFIGNDKILISDFSSEYSNISIRKSVKSLDNTIINKQQKAFLIQDLKNFENSKEWYNKVNITYKRSYLFKGGAGTGKTTISLAIARMLNRDVCCINLSNCSSDKDLLRIFNSVPEGSVQLIEDIDSFFDGRTPKENVKITFSGLINCLDGALSKENIITIITTNHPEKLDSALIRAGRVDVQMEIGNAHNEEIEEYLELFYGSKYYLGEEKYSVPMSLVQEKCILNKEAPKQAIKEIINCNTIPVNL